MYNGSYKGGTQNGYIMETVGLRKAYKDNIVVDDVNMHISKGAIYGFVGPNGAGKSTVMKMILSLIHQMLERFSF